MIGNLKMAKMKLDVYQKEAREELRRDAKAEGVALLHNFNTTIAFKREGNVVRFATAVHSPSEPHEDFSRKYGEYLALDRFFIDGQTVVMLAVDFGTMCDYMDMATHADHKKFKTM